MSGKMQETEIRRHRFQSLLSFSLGPVDNSVFVASSANDCGVWLHQWSPLGSHLGSNGRGY